MRRVCVVIGLVMLAGCGPDKELEAKLQQGREWVDMCVRATGVAKNPEPNNGQVTSVSRYPDVITAEYRDYDGRMHACEIRNLHRDEGRQPTISVKNF